MEVNLHIASDWIGVNYKNYREIFSRPLDFKAIISRLKEWRCPSRTKAACIVYSRRTAIRMAPFCGERVTSNWVYNHFPYGERFNESTHAFSFEIFNSATVFMAALPVAVLKDVCETCENLGIKNMKIKWVDIIERRLLIKHMSVINQRWLCFPLDNGLRILSMSGGSPKASYYISNDPAYRDAELASLTLPDEAIVFNGCDWLQTVLYEAHIEIIEGGEVFEAV